MNPYPHQVEGARMMAAENSFLLADEPGLGKTLTVAMAVVQGWQGGTVAVLCPRNVIEHWENHFKLLGFKGNLIVTNFESLDKFQKAEDVRALIVDESHKLKNEVSERFGKTYMFLTDWNWKQASQGRSVKVYLSTGTPVYSYPIDLLTSLILLNKISYTMIPAFKMRYCAPTRQRRGRNTVLDMRGASNLDELKRLCAPFMLRRTWEDTGIKMPPVTLTDLEVGAKITDSKYFEASANFNKFYVENGGTPGGASMARFTVLRHILAVAKIPAAIEQALDDLKGNQKTLFFTEFRDVAEGVAEGVERAGGKSLLVLGGQSVRKREEILREFKAGSKPVALIATTDSLGEGTDGLQEVCHLVNFIDLDFEPTQFVQALRRLLRLKQRYSVTVRRFFVAGDKMEEFIIENWAKKERILRALGLNSDSSLHALQQSQ